MKPAVSKSVRRSGWWWLLANAGVAAACIVLELSGTWITRPGDHLLLFSPMAGVALAAAILGGWKIAPGVASGMLLAWQLAGGAAEVSLLGGGGGAAAALLTGALLRRLRLRNDLGRIRDALLISGGALLSGAGTAVAATLVYCGGAHFPWAFFNQILFFQVIADTAGALLVAPVIVTWAGDLRPALDGRRILEFVGVVALAAAGLAAGLLPPTPRDYSMLWIALALIPPVAWAALRLGPRCTALTLLCAYAVSIRNATLLLPPAREHLVPEDLAELWALHALTLITGLVVAAATTQRRAAVAALAANEARFREIVDQMPVLFNALDAAGNIVAWNRDAERVTGYAAAEVVGNPDIMAALYPEREYRERMHARWRAEPTFRDREWTLRAKDGSERIIAWSSTSTEHPLPGWASWAIGVDVTARRQAERQLEESLALLSALLHYAPVGFAFFDTELRYRRVNALLAKINGRTPEGHIGRTTREVVPHLPAGVEANQRRVLETGRPLTGVEVRTPVRDDDGVVREHTFLVNYYPVHTGDARLLGVGVVLVDISELRRAEQSVQENEALLREIAESLEEVVWITAVDPPEVLYASPAFERIWGRPVAELRTNPALWLECVHPADQARVAAHFAEWAAGGRAGDATIEYRVRRPDGAVRWVRDRASPVRNAAGEVYRVAGIAEDITDRKQAEMALRESEERFRTLANQAPVKIWLADDAGRPVYFNRRWLEFTGGSLDEEISGGWHRSVHPDDWAVLAAEWADLRQAREPRSCEFRLRRRDGVYRTMLQVCSPRRLPDGTFAGFIGSCVDITEHKQLEESLAQTRKLQAVARLAVGVAHDLNNLMTAVLGYLQLAAGADEAGRQAQLAGIGECTQRAIGLTRQLLALGRQQPLTPRVLDLNQAVAGMTRLLRNLLGEAVELTTALDAARPQVCVDPTQLEQVILNLTTNARDAMPEGGRVMIATRNADVDTAELRLSPRRRAGRFVVLTVEDNGAGMSADVLEHVFEAFFSTKDPQRGTGLGLAIVDGIVEQSGGFIDVSSAPGAGTTFDVFLPAADAETPPPPRAAAPGRPPRVLIVEDEELVRELLVQILQDAGYDAVAAPDAETVLHDKTLAKDCDALITDVRLPGVSGPELAARLRAAQPVLTVIFVSGMGTQSLREAERAMPGARLIEKPFEPDRLVAELGRLLHAR